MKKTIVTIAIFFLFITSLKIKAADINVHNETANTIYVATYYLYPKKLTLKGFKFKKARRTEKIRGIKPFETKKINTPKPWLAHKPDYFFLIIKVI